MSELAERATNAGKTYSMELIFFPLFLLLFVGIIANNYQATGIQTTPTLITPCQSLAICYPTNTNGCDNSPSTNCNLTTTSSFSFLNRNSPFTLLVTGNVLGFIGYIFQNPSQINNNQISETICIPLAGNPLKFVNASGSAIQMFECLGNITYGNATNPDVQIPLNASSSNGNNSDWSLTGCGTAQQLIQCGVVNYTQATAFFYGGYILNGTTITGSTQCTWASYIFTACLSSLPRLLVGSSPTFVCPSTASVTVPSGVHVNILKTKYYCLLPVTQPTNASNLTNTFSVFGFLVGIFLILLGLGLAISLQVIASGTSLGINDQGAKLAQVFGVGLVLWSFIYGEFGASWLPNLPFNLGTIGFVALTAMFFMGLYWRLFTLD